MNRMMKVTIPVASLAVALACGCKKEEPAPSAQQPQAAAPAAQPAPAAAGPVFVAGAPAALAGKTPAPGGKAYVDAINNKGDKVVSVTGEEGMNANGWAIDEKSKSAAGPVVIELKPVAGGESFYATAQRSSRPDLAKTFKDEAYGKAGFNVKADVKGVPAGDYNINVIQAVDGNPILAETGKKIKKTN